jgi:hypothetical protein
VNTLIMASVSNAALLVRRTMTYLPPQARCWPRGNAGG